MLKASIKKEIFIQLSGSLRFIKNIVRYISHHIVVFKRNFEMALFFVILLWFSIVILTLLTLHEVMKKYIRWIVEDYLSKREESSKKSKR
ncbi:MAG TPA: hypothetical protein DIC64_00640 [Alphaproteobacteria bacterium]|nr:hypothetical protein [Alphaproteobacteria bacterium]